MKKNQMFCPSITYEEAKSSVDTMSVGENVRECATIFGVSAGDFDIFLSKFHEFCARLPSEERVDFYYTLCGQWFFKKSPELLLTWCKHLISHTKYEKAFSLLNPYIPQLVNKAAAKERFLRAMAICCEHALAGWHFRMLNDRQRNQAYRRAIAKEIDNISGQKPLWIFGDLQSSLQPEAPELPLCVLDIGTGTGLLASYAAKHLEKIGKIDEAKVFACEQSAMISSIAEEVIETNKLPIKLIPKMNSKQLCIDEHLDGNTPSLVVMELMDCGFFGEGMISTCLDILDKCQQQKENQKPPTIIPRKGLIYIALLECDQVRREHVASPRKLFAKTKNRRLICSNACQRNTHKACYAYDSLDLRHFDYRLLSEPYLIDQIHFDNRRSLQDHLRGLRRDVRIPVLEKGTLNGILLWWEVELTEGISITNFPTKNTDGYKGPICCPCWDQAIFPTSQGFEPHGGLLDAGDQVNVTYKGGEQWVYCYLSKMLKSAPAPIFLRFHDIYGKISLLNDDRYQEFFKESMERLNQTPYVILGIHAELKTLIDAHQIFPNARIVIFRPSDADDHLLKTLKPSFYKNLTIMERYEDVNFGRDPILVLCCLVGQSGLLELGEWMQNAQRFRRQTRKTWIIPETVQLLVQLVEIDNQYTTDFKMFPDEQTIGNGLRISQAINRYESNLRRQLKWNKGGSPCYKLLSETKCAKNLDLREDSLEKWKSCVELESVADQKSGTNVALLLHWRLASAGLTYESGTLDSGFDVAAFLLPDKALLSKGDSLRFTFKYTAKNDEFEIEMNEVSI